MQNTRNYVDALEEFCKENVDNLQTPIYFKDTTHDRLYYVMVPARGHEEFEAKADIMWGCFLCNEILMGPKNVKNLQLVKNKLAKQALDKLKVEFKSIKITELENLTNELQVEWYDTERKQKISEKIISLLTSNTK